MKYKVGDKVLIKSPDWYYKNRDKIGQVDCGGICFIQSMVTFCGQIVTISSVLPTLEVYRIKEDGGAFNWTDEMIERLAERNGKTYPYKIGDRVVLKGNNKCATITDLKYNSSGNLSYYIKIDNDKDISVDYPTDLLLPYDKLVEEECPQDFIETYCKSCGTQRCDRTEEFLNGCPYYISYMRIKQNNDMEKEISLNKSGQIADFEYEGLAYTLPNGYQFVDEKGNVINATKIALEKKKKEYPKTYEECCKVLDWNHRDYDRVGYEAELLCKFQVLLLCRDAYWKIAGDEMGLEEPWKPDWKNRNQSKYCICNDSGDIKKVSKVSLFLANSILSFPTEEMRDAFYKNFNKLIEICKELL